MDELLKSGARDLGIELTECQIEQCFKYIEILLEWNKKINLTAITDLEDVIVKHFLDSMSIIKFIPENVSCIDVGTGAGFPGIVMKIVRPDIRMVLLDSINKRIVFLQDVVDKLKLKEVSLIHGRAEDISRMKKYREMFDIVTARGVAALPVLMEICLPFVKIGGKFIAFKGESVLEEAYKSDSSLAALGGQLEEIDKVNLKGYNHYLLCIKKILPCSIKYPRKLSQIVKKQL